MITYIFTQTLRFIIIRRNRTTSKINFFGTDRRAFAYRGNVEQLTVLYIKKLIRFYSNQLHKNNNLLVGANIDNFTYLNTHGNIIRVMFLHCLKMYNFWENIHSSIILTISETTK